MDSRKAQNLALVAKKQQKLQKSNKNRPCLLGFTALRSG
jgi:hypothetical protein